MAGDPAGFGPTAAAAPDGGCAAGGVWTGMPEATGYHARGDRHHAGQRRYAEPNERTPVTGDTMSDAESAMPEADVSKQPDAGSGTGVPAPAEDPPGTT